MRRAQAGFTLIEIVIALALLATMLAMAWSGVSFALRSWDAGANQGHRTADARLSQNFLRRELSELFPMRFKDAMTLKYAFEAGPDHLRFVSTRPAGLSSGGLSLVGLAVEQGEGRTRNLVMRRAPPDDAAKDFGPLERAEGTVLISNVESVVFSYFGSTSDVEQPKWWDEWTQPRIPSMIRIRYATVDGEQPDLLVRVMLSEEAGCLENAFQRNCRPRRP